MSRDYSNSSRDYSNTSRDYSNTSLDYKTHHLTVVTYQVVIEARLSIIAIGHDVVRTDLVHLTNLTEHSVSNEFISYSAMFL